MLPYEVLNRTSMHTGDLHKAQNIPKGISFKKKITRPLAGVFSSNI